jgi:ribosomal protein L6P/L9E
MSRVAKMPVAVPEGVDVTIKLKHTSASKAQAVTLSIANNALVKVAHECGQAELCSLPMNPVKPMP